MTTTEKEILAFINSNEVVQSLLWDLELMPEQLTITDPDKMTINSEQWSEMVNIVGYFRNAVINARASMQAEAIKAVESAQMPPRSEALKAYNVGIEEAVKKLKELKP